MKKQKFKAELLTGHKGAAVIVPFDPEEVWGAPPRQVVSKVYGKRPGHVVKGSLNGHPFEGWIGHRWGRFFILVDVELQEAAGLSVGDMVDVSVGLKAARKKT
jgi:hypothetical protein